MKYTATFEGIPGITTRVVASDVVQYLAAAIYTLNSSPAKSVIISCETQQLRYAFEVDPTQGAAGLGHILYVGQTIELNSGRLIREFRFINAANAVDGFMQVTALFESGVN